MPIRGTPRDFYKRFAFTVEIKGIAWAGFRACSELRSTMAVIEHSEGGALVPNKGFGRFSFANVTLQRGATQDADIYEWWQEHAAQGATVEDQQAKRTLDIVQLNRNGVEIERWTLFNAFIAEFTPGEGGWDNEADENRIESIVLGYDFFEKGGDAS